jgi:hypothetical protein
MVVVPGSPNAEGRGGTWLQGIDGKMHGGERMYEVVRGGEDEVEAALGNGGWDEGRPPAVPSDVLMPWHEAAATSLSWPNLGMCGPQMLHASATG